MGQIVGLFYILWVDTPGDVPQRPQMYQKALFMEVIKNTSFTTEENGIQTETMLMAFSPKEQEENNINRANAKLIEAPEFVPMYLGVQKRFNLTDSETKLYGYIRFFTFEGRQEAYLTNPQLAYILNMSEPSVTRSVSTLSKYGLIKSTNKILSDNGKIKTIRKLTLTSNQNDETLANQNDEQLINIINNNILSKDNIDELSSLLTSNSHTSSSTLLEKKQFGNVDVNYLIEFLKGNYPHQLTGISDRNKVSLLVRVSAARKGRDEWMSPDWKVNFHNFLKQYMANTDTQYLVRSVDSLRVKLKDWREAGGPKVEAPKSNQWSNFV